MPVQISIPKGIGSHYEFRIGNGFFSCIHFGMDDWGKYVFE